MLKKKTNIFLLVGAWFIALACIFTGLGEFPLIDPDEGRNAEIAREMKDAHSYLIPLYNGLPRLDKPALYFDTLALSFNLFGENETAARLPSAIFAVLTLILVCLFCWYVYDLRVAAITVLVLGSTPLFIIFSRITILDMQFTFFVFASLISGYLALEHATRAKTWSLLTILAAALATLIKGPIGFILPTLGLVTYARSSKIKGGRCFFSPLNTFVFFSIVLLWFFSLLGQRPDFAYYGLFTESLGRFFAAGKIHRVGSIYYYAPVIFAVFFPWSLLLVGMAIRGWQQRSKARPADRLLACFALVVILFFSVSQSKLPGYILPAIVALGPLVARVFSVAGKASGTAMKGVIQGSTGLLVSLAGFVAGLVILYYFGILNFQGLFHLSGKITALLQLLSAPFVIILPIICLMGIGARLTHSIVAMLIVFALTPILLGVTGARGLKEYAEQLSSRRLAQKINTLLPEKGKVVCYQCMPIGLPFYLRQTIAVISNDGSELTGNYIKFSLGRTLQWPEQMIRPGDALKWFALQKEPIFLLVHRQHPPGKVFAALTEVRLKRITQRWLGGLAPT